MAHEENNFGGGTEFADSDEQKISQMLGGLKRVEAPKDFDFHLKSRIAKGRPEEVRPASLLPILKYALPLALVLLVSAGILLRSSYSTIDTPTVAEANTTQPSLPTNVVGPADPVNSVSVPGTVPGNERRPSIGGTSDVASSPKEPSGGTSKDFTSRPDRPLLLPPEGRSTDRAIRGAEPALKPRGTGQKKYSAREGLELLGIDANFENGKWTVKAVKPNMAGDQVGVKQGDRVLALDGKPIDEKTEFDGGVSVKTITVSRDGKTLELDSKNKPK